MVADLARVLHLNPTVFYMLYFATLVMASLAVGFVLNRIIHYWTRKLANTWGEPVFALFESLPIPLLFLGSIYTGLELITLPHRFERFASKLIFTLTVVVVFYFPAKVLVISLRRVGERNPGIKRVTKPAILVVRTLFAVLTIIVVLENLGASLTGLWTTLGVSGLVVALALQETLSNLFAGLYLLADRPVSPGDYIKLDSGQEGYVVHTGWRSTTLRTQSNNFVFVPNSTMAKAVITNYSMPELRVSITITSRVAYGSDPREVEKVLLDVTREAAKDGFPGLLLDPAPSVALNPGFGESSLDFSLGVNVRRFEDQVPVQSELRKRILARFAAQGIVVPFPMRTVGLDPPTLESLRAGPLERNRSGFGQEGS